MMKLTRTATKRTIPRMIGPPKASGFQVNQKSKLMRERPECTEVTRITTSDQRDTMLIEQKSIYLHERMGYVMERERRNEPKRQH